MKKNTLVAVLFALAHFSLYSQSTASHTVRIIAHPILELKFDESLNNTEFYFSTLSDYDNGITNLQAAGLKVRSNRDWLVNVKANSQTFNSESLGESEIKSSVLKVRKTGSNTEIPVDIFDQVIATGSNGGFDKNRFSLDYIANPGYILPDNYSIELTYTLTSP
ncbi:hypothetical protein EGI22_04935 [Lacihabitans sp. LS3-19]|uniref:hypothetical protein n=1 Tax=Lacihabitans sp. LS3-19 TaxID=2487335 RepID=UPI0020CD7A17|nr:hypothetical protein [Lacihabitans sp. LS3-19]MCP9767245.1 hypothetical protein [Lacihabitans sp. LS3-19]